MADSVKRQLHLIDLGEQRRRFSMHVPGPRNQDWAEFWSVLERQIDCAAVQPDSVDVQLATGGYARFTGDVLQPHHLVVRVGSAFEQVSRLFNGKCLFWILGVENDWLVVGKEERLPKNIFLPSSDHTSNWF